VYEGDVANETEEQAKRALIREGFGHLADSVETFTNDGTQRRRNAFPSEQTLGMFERQDDLFQNAAKHNNPFFVIETDATGSGSQ
jgi:hypothetical protein